MLSFTIKKALATQAYDLVFNGIVIIRKGTLRELSIEANTLARKIGAKVEPYKRVKQADKEQSLF